MLAVCAVLPDGTPSYAPVGVVVRDGPWVMCHLCGHWFKSVVAHLRAQPEQRRRKTLAALAAIRPEARPAGGRRHADERLRQTARAAVARLGFADIGSLVRARVAGGASVAAISREAGLHKDWLCRHLSTVDATALAASVPDRWDVRWLPVVRTLGLTDVAAYLTDRHTVRKHTIRAIATEIGLPRTAVESAFARRGIARQARATSRASRDERAIAVAARFGFTALPEYLANRRAAGMSWRGSAAECGQPQTWIRRQAGLG